MAVIVEGFTILPGPTFGGRVQHTADSSHAIKIVCVTEGRPQHGSTSQLLSLEGDEEFLSGFLSWLSFRERRGLPRIRAFDFHLRDRSREPYIRTITRAMVIRSGCTLTGVGATTSTGPAVPRLLKFAEDIRIEGNKAFRAGKFDASLDLYESSVLALSEWDTLMEMPRVDPSIFTQPRSDLAMPTISALMQSRQQKEKWANASLDAFSNSLQARIQLHRYSVEDELRIAVQSLVTQDPRLSKQKKAKCLRRLARLQEMAGDPGALISAAGAFIYDPTSREGLDLVQRLIPASRPATDETIESLPKVVVDDEWLETHPGDDFTICLDTYDKDGIVTELKCGHAFHRHCVITWVRQRAVCPCCKRSVS